MLFRSFARSLAVAPSLPSLNRKLVSIKVFKIRIIFVKSSNENDFTKGQTDKYDSIFDIVLPLLPVNEKVKKLIVKPVLSSLLGVICMKYSSVEKVVSMRGSDFAS